MKYINLTKGFKTIIDDEDFIWVSQYTWHTNMNHGFPYARTAFKRNYKIRYIYLHRAIIGAKRGEEVDHKNVNALDNRRMNLRIVTHQENCANRKPKRSKKKAA